MVRAPERGAHRPGFSLVELMVALVILEIGLLGVFGLTVLATRRMADAAELQRAGGALAWVADSLVAAGGSDAGRRTVEPFEIEWQREGGAIVVQALRRDSLRTVVLEVELEGLR